MSGCVLRNHDCGFAACTWPGLMVSMNVVTKVGVCETSVESISLFLKGCSIGSSGLSERYSCCPASGYGVSGVVTRVPGTQCSGSSAVCCLHTERGSRKPLSLFMETVFVFLVYFLFPISY